MPEDSESPPPGKILTLLRWLHGWPQKDLAATLGCRSSLLSGYETGRKPLSRSRLLEIAARMGVAPEEIDEVADFWKSFQSQRDLGPGDAKARRRALIQGTFHHQSRALSELVCQKSLDAAADRADHALTLAELAVCIAELVPGDPEGARRVQGSAWAYLGNAWRVAGNLPAADGAFRRSRDLWEAGKAAQSERLHAARVLGMEASLRRDQGQLAKALTRLERALTLADGEERKKLFLNRANILELTGDSEEAISALRELEPLLSGETEPRLLWILYFTLINNLLHVDRLEEAQALLSRTREMAYQLGNDLDVQRTLWLEARIAACLGRREEAFLVLFKVREDFTARGMAYDVALVLLDLALLYYEEGQIEEVRILVGQMVPIFKAQGNYREVLAALRLCWGCRNGRRY